MLGDNVMKQMEIESIKVSDLIPYENNPRINDEAVEYVANSIKEFGFKVPIIIDKNNVIIAGHTRLKASEKLGLDEVPCIRAEDLDEDQVKAFRLADNKVGEIAVWDMEKLNIELDDINMDMVQFGFDDIGFDDLNDDDFNDNPYTMKTNIPQYEITGECPTVYELRDTDKMNELLAEIEEADISDEDKAFLTLASYRHIVFNYKKIAEYYAHASAEVQRLMEKSALVIIDVDDAIKNGYVKLSEEIIDIQGEDLL